MHVEEVALAARWRKNVCIEDKLHLHTENLMSLQLHKGTMISTSADHTIRLTDVDGSWLREEASA